jgi:hypothetical protein
MTTPNSNHKSKEEILEKNELGDLYSIASALGWEFDNFKKCIHDSMEEYASIRSREEAVGFAKFAMENTFQDMNVLDLDGREDKWEYANGDVTGSITTDQLYELYTQQSKNKTT